MNPFNPSFPLQPSLSLPPPPYPMTMIPGTGGIMPTVVIGAPPMIHHPVLPPPVMPMPFVPPNWQQRLLATPATQPLTLYIGKIPSELDNDFLLKLLETCGKVQKWNRPEDLNARTLKPFGFVTYAQGTSALRCKNVLDGLSICGGTLQIKSGTKETAALNSIASSERSPPPQIDPYTRLPIPQQEIDTNALYDAPLRELVHKLIEKRLNKSESDELDSEIAVLEAKTKGFIRTEEHEDESTYDREKQILREIEKFRERQAKRDRELEQKRNDRIIMKLREMEDQQKNQEETTSKSEVKLTPSTLPLSHSVLKDKDRLNEIDDFNQNNSNNNSNNESSNNNSNGNSNSNGNGNKRELETEEEIEAKRRRRQEVFSMVSGDETQLNFESNQTSQNPPEISGNITETTREQTLANLAASISNKAIGGKLTLKNNMKNATKKAAFGNEDDDSEKRGLRQIIPIDYTEEEQRSLHLTSEEHAAQFLLKMERTNSSSSSINSGAAINNNKNHNNNNNSNNNNNNNSNNNNSVAITNPPVDSETIKKQKLKEIVDKIPTSRDQLFSYPIDWNACEKYNVIESSIRSWVVKKFIEYLGEEEVTLTNFILKKISQRCNPEELLSELEPVLDRDTESFVLKLWRMLIFNVIKADIDSGGDGQGGYKLK